MSKDKLLGSNELFEALAEAGICSLGYARKWIQRMETQGRIIYPREFPNEPRKFTANDIKEIVAAFRPCGKQRWKFKKS